MNCIIIEDFRQLFQVEYAPRDSTVRPDEEATYIKFIDFIEKCEGNKIVSSPHPVTIN